MFHIIDDHCGALPLNEVFRQSLVAHVVGASHRLCIQKSTAVTAAEDLAKSQCSRVCAPRLIKAVFLNGDSDAFCQYSATAVSRTRPAADSREPRRNAA